MGLFAEFKKFAVKGNVIDMAVGIVVGSAFTSIVNSLVNDMIMPLVGVVTGGINFTEMKAVLKEAVLDAEGNVTQNAVTVNYGSFIQYIVNFFIVAFSMFLVVRILNRAKDRIHAKEIAEEAAKKEAEAKAAEEAAAAKAAEPTTEQLLAEIRDLLKTKN